MMNASYIGVLGLVIALVGVGVVAVAEPVVALGVFVVVVGLGVVSYAFVSMMLEKFGMGFGDFF